MGTSKNPYRTLGVSRDAGDREIRKAYLRRVKKDHPDAGEGGDEDFCRLHDAYESIRTRKRRREHAHRTGEYAEGLDGGGARVYRGAHQGEYRTHAAGNWTHGTGSRTHAAGPAASPRGYAEHERMLATLFDLLSRRQPYRIRRYRAEVRVSRLPRRSPQCVNIRVPEGEYVLDLPADLDDGEVLTYRETDPRGLAVELDLHVRVFDAGGMS